MAETDSLKAALALAVSMLSAEHVFSASLSSPWTTGKLTQSEADRQAFWTLFTEAAVASYIFALAIGYLLQDRRALILSLVGTTAIVGWLYYDYSRALDGSLYGENGGDT